MAVQVALKRLQMLRYSLTIKRRDLKRVFFDVVRRSEVKQESYTDFLQKALGEWFVEDGTEDC
jgi:hypothetical protein